MSKWQHDDEDDLEEWEDPDEADEDDEGDMDDDESPCTLPCPHCRREVYEDEVRCPHCGVYMTPGAAMPRNTKWVIIAAILALVAMFAWLIR
jgi:hypothetical protein